MIRKSAGRLDWLPADRAARNRQDMVNYEIWDGESGNLLVTRPTQTEALAIVRDAIARFGDQYAEALALLRTDEHGGSLLIAEGAALAAMSRIAPVSFPGIDTKRAV